MVRLVIVRHCQTVGNAAQIFQGRTDTPISEQGFFQLGLLSARLRDEKIDVIYSSPLPRAKRTAEAINVFHNVPVVELESLQEIFVGEIDGMSSLDIPRHAPEAAKAWNEAPWSFAPPGGETMGEVYARLQEAIMKIITENAGKTVAITSHGCAIRNLMCFLSGYPIESLTQIPLGANTSVSVVEAQEDGSFRVVLMSDSAHLPQSMQPTGKPFHFVLEEEA